MSKHIELAKKLKALAERGVGGEKLNAEKMLYDLLKEHGLTLEDIEEEAIQCLSITLKEDEVRLFHQIVGSVNRHIKMYRMTEKRAKEIGMKGNTIIECTNSEFIEIEAMFAIFGRLFNEELDVFYYAFCLRNNLLAQPTDKEKEEQKEITKEQYKFFMRAKEMSNNINKETYRKQIT